MYQTMPLSYSQMSLENAGLLNKKKDPFSDPNSLGLLGAGLSLLQASGPSTTPVSLGQAIGQAGMSGLQMRNQAIEDDFNKQYKQAQMQQMLKNNGMIGDLTPGNYTPESLQSFYDDYRKNMVPNYGLLKESVNQFRAGGVTYVMGPDGKPQALVDPGTVASNAGAIAGAQAAGAKAGEAKAEAAQSIGTLEDQEAQLVRIMNDPNFAGAVGPVDQYTGKLGEALGTPAGVLGGEIERVSNKLVTDAVSKWKGAISDKELGFFRASVPQRGSSPETWAHWYQNEYLPMKQRAEATAGVGAGGIKFLGFEGQ